MTITKNISLLTSVLIASNTLIIQAAYADDGPTPTAEVVSNLITENLQALIPQGFSKRDVTFQDIRPGKAYEEYSVRRMQAQAFYPYQVTLTILDFEPGYPPNKYYGSTCTSHLTKNVFVVSKDDFGSWAIQGAWSPMDKDCKPNPPR